MKKFTFDLEQVLEYRNFEQQQAEAELQKALAVETEIQNNLETIASQYISTNQQTKNSVNFDVIYSANQYLGFLKMQKEQLLNDLSKAKLVTDEKRNALSECMKKTNALKKLKEQQLEEYNKEVARQNKRFLDELGSQGYFRKLNSSEKTD